MKALASLTYPAARYIYGMKVLTRATEDVGIALRKFVTWAAEDCDRGARDKKSDFRGLPATALSKASLGAPKIRKACHDLDAAT